jgi:magnesium-transporting ATPase (P-type)
MNHVESSKGAAEEGGRERLARADTSAARGRVADGREERGPPWHALGADEVLERLDGRPDGLPGAEVEARRDRYGLNKLPEAPRPSALRRFARQFNNVLIYILLVAAAGTALLQLWIDTAVILGVVLLNALIGFIQEGKAQRAIEAIRGMLAPKAVVFRDGRRQQVDAEDLVPGDVVELGAGDRVPADLRWLTAKNLRIDEAILTGESVAADKRVEPVEPEDEVGDRDSLGFSGTMVAYGHGRGVVVGTGLNTEIGHISALLSGVEEIATPLLRQIAQFGRWLSLIIVLLAAATFAFGYAFRDYVVVDVFLAAVSLAVAAIPEGLPAVMTITLAIGVQKLAARNSVIRRLPVVETLGALTVIYSDKTGTLTRNEMTVKSIVTAEKLVKVGGVGYAPYGEFRAEGRAFDPTADPVLHEALRAALLCNDAELQCRGDTWTLEGDPTEGALVTAARKAGLVASELRAEYPRTDLIPFDSAHRFMATLHHDHRGHAFVQLKGAPEAVLEFCERERREGGDAPIDRAGWTRAMEKVARRGQRVLAIAAKQVDGQLQTLEMEDVQRGMTLVAMMGSMDPPREEAIAAVKTCQDAGIHVKMITGDHAITAGAIAAELGFAGDGKVITGRELEQLDDDELTQITEDTHVFARASPEHKLRLVRAAQANHHVVAMTGDGVNDAPALKRADVGIAMGIKGTEAAKDASAMVLADDNFATIARAVEQGRTVYDNLRKAILFLLPTNGGQALTIVAAIALGLSLPLSPLQVLWVNMVTAVTLGLALAFEPTEDGVMKRPPRRAREPILSGFLLWRVTFVSALLVGGTFGNFLWMQAAGADLDSSRTIAINTLVAAQVFYLINSRFIIQSSLSVRAFVGSRAVLVAIGVLVLVQGIFVYAPPMQYLFGTKAMMPADWARVLVFGLAVFVLVEAEKAVLRRLGR